MAGSFRYRSTTIVDPEDDRVVLRDGAVFLEAVEADAKGACPISWLLAPTPFKLESTILQITLSKMTVRYERCIHFLLLCFNSPFQVSYCHSRRRVR